MCTASHNPKAYTGAKLVARGALALSGDAGIGEVRDVVARGEPGPTRRPSAATLEEGRRRRLPARPRSKFIDPDAVDAAQGRARRRQRDGGPDGRPAARRAADRAGARPTGRRTASSPTTSRTRCSPENRAFIIEQGPLRGRRARASRGTATPTAASSSTTRGEFVDGDFLTALLAESILEKEPGRDDPLRRARQSRAVRDMVAAAGGTALINRVGHAFFKARMREEGAAFGGEVSGHYYFRDFYCADSGTIPALLILELLSKKGQRLSELLAPLRAKYFISGEINSEVEDQRGEDGRDRGALLRRRDHRARRRLGRLRRLALQRARRRTPSRCCG